MVAGRNFNIQTRVAQLAKGSHVAFGSSVAAGKTRYVTYVRVSQLFNGAGKGSRVIFSSTTLSAAASTLALASASQKLSIGIVSAVAVASQPAAGHVPKKTVALPDQPNTLNPLFTVAASKFFSAKLGSTAGTSASVVIYVQYYDQ